MDTIEMEASPLQISMNPVSLRGDSAGRTSGRTVEYYLRSTSMGTTLVAVTDEGVCAILLGDDADELVSDLTARFPGRLVRAGEEPGEWVSDALACVEGTFERGSSLPLDLKGTDFQKAVWTALLGIAPGETVTYSELAARIGRPSSVRAVARACGANHLAVVVPCHRVLRGDGSISGYRWGVERKRRLLEREGTTPTR